MHIVRRSFAAVLVGLISVSWFACASGGTSKPQYGAWGFDVAGADFSTNPGDNFFRYANGAWLDKARIPADKPAYSLRVIMTDRTEQRLHELMETLAAKGTVEPSSLEDKVGAFYHSFMDQGRVEQLGSKAIANELDDVKKAKNRAELAALMGRSATDFEHSLFDYRIDVDLKDPARYAFYLGQGGLALPDRDYYLTPAFAKQKAALQSYVAALLALLNWPDPATRAKDVVDFESQVAAASWSKAEQRDLSATYNPMSIDELRKWAPGFDWPGFLANARMKSLPLVIVQEKTAFRKIAAIYAKAPLDTIRAWHAFHIADNAAPYLSAAFTEPYFQLHNKALAGQQQERVRWKRAITAVSGGDFGVGDRFGTFGTMGFGVGRLYTAKYFPADAKAKIASLVAHVKDAFRARIEKLDWMGEETKRQALRKLDTYTIKVGYPDHPRDYTLLKVRGDDLIGNVRHAAAADWAFVSERFSGPVDRTDWNMTPQTNDAYNGSLRDIVFPAAILQPPIFDANADPAVNYGAAGAVIGHELTHGFDDEGRQFDAQGNLKNWWTKEDAAEFEKRAKCVSDQYSEYIVVDDVKGNGKLTLGEDVADLGGTFLAYLAWKHATEGRNLQPMEGFTPDQRFFIGMAQWACGDERPESKRLNQITNPHSLLEYRVNGVVSNMPEFGRAFSCKVGQPMVHEHPCKIW